MSADGLIIALGWSPDDFESAARKATREDLEEARRIASATYPEEDERSKQLSAHAVRFIDDLLAGNDGGYWRDLPTTPREPGR